MTTYRQMQDPNWRASEGFTRPTWMPPAPEPPQQPLVGLRGALRGLGALAVSLAMTELRRLIQRGLR